MRIVLSADMEGVSQLRDAREILAACPEYWRTGKPRYEADVVAACEGLLAGGAGEVIVLDNHGSGNPANIAADVLPAGARLETWNLWDVSSHGIDGMLQVGYHPRGGVDGFLSHTYVPGLRLRCSDELISESHGRAWAAGVPLLGIAGNDRHVQTLGSLAGTPFLVVQESEGHGRRRPVFGEREGLDAIRGFAQTCAASVAFAVPVDAPAGVTLAASLPNGDRVVEKMENGGWSRVGDVEYALELETWADAREPIAAAMLAGFEPLMHAWSNDLTSEEKAAAYDKRHADWLGRAIAAWAEASEPEWFTAPAPTVGAG